MAASPKTGDLELGRRIRERREELRISRKDLAEALGISYPYIAQIETGYRLPSSRHQVELARILGLSLDEVFGTDDDSGPPEVPPRRSGESRRRRPSLDEAVDAAARELESLPTAVRLEALSRVQLRIMTGVTAEQSATARGRGA